ncbi:molybdenum cofactor guanylyltransferase MobA [Methylomonas koyamae]|uniref:molybdenum cofactor guanylyltransferase MobA n=1 Tax=Methylomonas koyamae TaxID=702114 RepID=UPI000BC32ACD|nr:molybdenum cofactor guanylyltransferase MobA [Methylomonas koyamae]ATG89268.1 molybdenum cofactor guanylyltransferase [Methylomonas koyamae]
MSGQNKVSGVVLAGGLARRMQHRDKGLILFGDRPLVSYALAALAPLAQTLLISANRNQEQYRGFGYRVISDANPTFDGPLAGILAALQAAPAQVLLTAPCDSPFVRTEHFQKLLDALHGSTADIAVAFDGERLHPVFAAIRTHLQADLQDYLLRGERKLQVWFRRHAMVEVDFGTVPEVFANINSPAELEALQLRGGLGRVASPDSEPS